MFSDWLLVICDPPSPCFGRAGWWLCVSEFVMGSGEWVRWNTVRLWRNADCAVRLWLNRRWGGAPFWMDTVWDWWFVLGWAWVYGMTTVYIVIQKYDNWLAWLFLLSGLINTVWMVSLGRIPAQSLLNDLLDDQIRWKKSRLSNGILVMNYPGWRLSTQKEFYL